LYDINQWTKKKTPEPPQQIHLLITVNNTRMAQLCFFVILSSTSKVNGGRLLPCVQRSGVPFEQ
jgi:hypothetical protein